MRSVIIAETAHFVNNVQNKKEFLYKQAIPFFVYIAYNMISKGIIP